MGRRDGKHEAIGDTFKGESRSVNALLRPESISRVFLLLSYAWVLVPKSVRNQPVP